MTDGADKQRRAEYSRRRRFYEDNFESLIKEEVGRVFKTPEVKQRIDPFVRMACSVNLYKRVVDEVARPVYSIPPTRTVSGADSDSERYSDLVRVSSVNERMDLGVRLHVAMNHVWLYPRYVARLRQPVIDVITPDMASVIPDPDDPTRELAFMYSRRVKNGAGENKILWVFWDDEERFQFDEDGNFVPFADPGVQRFHSLGRLPFVGIHRRARWGEFWDQTTGKDLESSQISISLLTALVLKLHKSQGEKQIVVQGDTGPMIHGQTIDAEMALVAPEGTSISTLDLRSDANHYTNTIDRIVEMVAANYGLNRDRINAKTSNPADDVALLERRAESIKTFWRAEHELFELLKLVSGGTEYGLSEGAKLQHVDFGEIEARMSLKERLEIWQELERMGLRNRLDDVKALNPEVTTNADAWLEYQENLEIRAKRIEAERALNAPQDADTNGPGQSPQANGAMGPMVRDGLMTREDAASMVERSDDQE